jgi:hypothetical protein
MAAIKFHLEDGEMSAVAKLAGELGVDASDVAYAALHRLMLDAQTPEVRAAVREAPEWRGVIVPVWSRPGRTAVADAESPQAAGVD